MVDKYRGSREALKTRNIRKSRFEHFPLYQTAWKIYFSQEI